MKRFATVTILALACAILMGAQNPPPMPTPGPEVKKLDYFAGTWKSEGVIKPGPMGPGGKFSETVQNEWMPGKFFLVSHGSATTPMGAETSLAVYGYDADAKVYTYDEFASSGEALHAKGTVSGDTWTWNAEDKTGRGRYTATALSPTSFTFKLEFAPPGKDWSTIMEGTFNKAK